MREPASASLDLRLLDEFQRDFPLVPTPFAAVAERLGTEEREVLDALARLSATGTVSRVGAVFRPGAVNASTLAALAAPADELDSAAEIVGAFPEVSHNYERENAWNLWFVATASDAGRLDAVLREIEARTRRRVLRLPLVEEYHIDLGFRLDGSAAARRAPAPAPIAPAPATITPRERRLVAALQPGLPLVPRPFAAIAEAADLTESALLDTLARWHAQGIVRRFGVIVRHRELGFAANAMAVWDVPDDAAAEAGLRLAREPRVTLAYRRARSVPDWRFNLYCMVHGRERDEVAATLAAVAARAGLAGRPHAVLFSLRRFKQTGAQPAREEGAWTPSIA
jgi:DNA-binding Lrp family transcriptional regulator